MHAAQGKLICFGARRTPYCSCFAPCSKTCQYAPILCVVGLEFPATNGDFCLPVCCGNASLIVGELDSKRGRVYRSRRVAIGLELHAPGHFDQPSATARRPLSNAGNSSSFFSFTEMASPHHHSSPSPHSHHCSPSAANVETDAVHSSESASRNCSRSPASTAVAV